MTDPSETPADLDLDAQTITDLELGEDQPADVVGGLGGRGGGGPCTNGGSGCAGVGL